MISSVVLVGSVAETCEVLYCPAGVNSKLPSGAKVNLRKNEVNVSLAYILAFFTPSPPRRPGEGTSSGLTAGKGRDGAGEADRRIDGEEPKDERRLCDTGGGSMGKFEVIGVPGVEGAGDTMAAAELGTVGWERIEGSGGAGLLEEMRLAGRSILRNFPWEVRVNCPSFVFKL